MIPTNSTIIRKAYDDFANGDIPAVLPIVYAPACSGWIIQLAL